MIHEVIIEEKDGNPTAPHCDVYKDNKDEIKWTNHTTKDCVLEFTETPFDEGKTFKVEKGKSKGSGRLRSDAKKEHSYAYTITAMAGANVMAADPNVIVH